MVTSHTLMTEPLSEVAMVVTVYRVSNFMAAYVRGRLLTNRRLY